MALIAFVGSKTTTFECVRTFLENGHTIDLLVTLTPEMGAKHNVAGYMDLRPLAQEHKIPIYHPKSYSLKSIEDREALSDARIDCALVIGWQRLIPEWWLNCLKIGAFGMHGSPEPLPRGRGRSPMNWALLDGKKSFITHLFKYDAGIDSGSIVGIQKFDITKWDDCNTLHLKNRLAMNRLIEQHIDSILNNTVVYKVQPTNIEPTYYPKRTPEDGRVVWEKMDMDMLYNHIRAQTRPFPGAFSYIKKSKECRVVRFWHGHPFDTHLTYYGVPPGKVVEFFCYDQSFWSQLGMAHYESMIMNCPLEWSLL